MLIYLPGLSSGRRDSLGSLDYKQMEYKQQRHLPALGQYYGPLSTAASSPAAGPMGLVQPGQSPPPSLSGSSSNLALGGKASTNTGVCTCQIRVCVRYMFVQCTVVCVSNTGVSNIQPCTCVCVSDVQPCVCMNVQMCVCVKYKVVCINVQMCVCVKYEVVCINVQMCVCVKYEVVCINVQMCVCVKYEVVCINVQMCVCQI